jgi:hypothetical protein
MTLPLLRLRSSPGEAPEPLVPAPETPLAAQIETAAQPAAPVAVKEAAAMPVLAQCVAVARHAFRLARRRGKDLAEKDGGWVNALLAAKPPSVNEQREYLRSRGWLPPGHEGGIADKAGRWYHRLVGIPGVAAGNAIASLCARPFRFFCALIAVCAVLALAVKVA